MPSTLHSVRAAVFRLDFSAVLPLLANIEVVAAVYCVNYTQFTVENLTDLLIVFISFWLLSLFLGVCWISVAFHTQYRNVEQTVFILFSFHSNIFGRLFAAFLHFGRVLHTARGHMIDTKVSI